MCCLLLPRSCPRGISYLSFDGFREEPTTLLSSPLKHAETETPAATQAASQTRAGLPWRRVYCFMLEPFRFMDFGEPGAHLNWEGLVFMAEAKALPLWREEVILLCVLRLYWLFQLQQDPACPHWGGRGGGLHICCCLYVLHEISCVVPH